MLHQLSNSPLRHHIPDIMAPTSTGIATCPNATHLTLLLINRTAPHHLTVSLHMQTHIEIRLRNIYPHVSSTPKVFTYDAPMVLYVTPLTYLNVSMVQKVAFEVGKYGRLRWQIRRVISFGSRVNREELKKAHREYPARSEPASDQVEAIS